MKIFSWSVHLLRRPRATPQQDNTAHFIREEVLKQIVWGRIFDVTVLFFDDIMAFKEMIYAQRYAEAEKEMKRRKREVGQAKNRL